MSLIRRHRPVRIGEFVLDPGPNELRRGQSVQRLPAKLADLLLRLAAEPGRMVARETLLDEVWERRQVNDEVLSRAIADLRQALGDEARAPRYIETLPKRGYRLVADVGDVAPDAESRPDAAAVHAPDREPDAGPAPSPAAGRSRRFTPRRALVAALFAATGLVYLARDDTPSSTAPHRLACRGRSVHRSQPVACAAFHHRTGAGAVSAFHPGRALGGLHPRPRRGRAGAAAPACGGWHRRSGAGAGRERQPVRQRVARRHPRWPGYACARACAKWCIAPCWAVRRECWSLANRRPP
jgi:DNA-binding winged helix-turn-helix (wHTH) protein